MSRFRDVVAGYAAELRARAGGAARTGGADPERRDSLFGRLQQAEIHLDRGTFDLARDYVDDQLAQRAHPGVLRQRFAAPEEGPSRPPAPGGHAGDAGPRRRRTTCSSPRCTHSSAGGCARDVSAGYAGIRTTTLVPRPTLALHGDLAAPPLHQPTDDRQPEPRAARRGREPRLEDPRQQLRRNPGSIVGHLDSSRAHGHVAPRARRRSARSPAGSRRPPSPRPRGPRLAPRAGR